MSFAQLPAEIKLKETDVPSTTLRLLTGQQEGVARSSGIFTKEDLTNIKKYVRKGLSLPFNLEEVKQYLGYQTIGIVGLEPEDINKLYQEIRAHSLTWEAVESSVKDQSIQLEIVGKQITDTGEAIISAINEMPIIVRIKEKVSNLYELKELYSKDFHSLKEDDKKKLEDAKKKLAAITYYKEDNDISHALREILDDMKGDIKIQQQKTAKVKIDVHDFRIKMIGGKLSNGETAMGLQPQVRNKKDLLEKNHMSVTIKDLADKITAKNQEIDQLKKDYDKFVALSFSGAPGGFIGLAITGGIFGSKAEEARKRKNALIEEVRSLEDSVQGKRSLQDHIEHLNNEFNDIDIRLQDTAMALGHLEFMWQSMLSQIDASKGEFDKINDALNLLLFVTKFQHVISPWKEVRGSAQSLVKLFDEA
ncbi:alpha-xenorhabdolysin family binary toxin subunit A [Xenorhabdus cabanillasii]|uniref:alpha-xenorhabdolysin family binary toxin subunit A n=1 Tax=Xenorhabdus cabanillasii TaxID=351673 RepID=UPI002B40EEF5|nr:alpha-xenorhabdolysin family binary toxin subunit A [Xenorhabdus sp. Flor]